MNGLIKLDSLACSDKIAPKRNCHKFLFKLSLVFCCGRHHSFYGNTKTCVIVSTLVFIFLLFLVKNREWDTLKNRCFAISNMLPCRSPYFSSSCKGINYARLQKIYNKPNPINQSTQQLKWYYMHETERSNLLTLDSEFYKFIHL